MKKTLSIAGFVLALMTIGAAPALAQHCGGHGGGMGAGGSDGAVFGGEEAGGPGGCGCMAGHGGKHHGKDGMGGKMGPGFWKNPEMAKKLDLTEAQIKKIEAIHEGGMKTGEAVHKEMKELKSAMKDAFKASPVDANKVKAIAEKISAKKAQMFMMHVQMKVETMNILTAEQKTRLMEMKAGHGMGGGKMKGCDCDKDDGCKCGGGDGCKCGGGDGCKCGGGSCPMMDDDDD